MSQGAHADLTPACATLGICVCRLTKKSLFE